MIRFAANLTMMFTEWSFLDRFEAAAEAGFGAVEFLFPYEFEPEAVGSRLRACELELALSTADLPKDIHLKRSAGTLPES